MLLFLLSPILSATATAIPSLEYTDQEHCRFTLGAKQYDLCPIMNGAASRSPQHTNDKLAGVPASTAEEEAHDWPWTYPCRPGVDNCVSRAISSASESEVNKESRFTLRAFPSGTSIIAELSRPPGAPAIPVRLICDADQELRKLLRPGQLEPISSWLTKFACPLPPGNLHSSSFAGLADDSTTDPPPGEEEGNDDSEQLLDGKNRHSRRSTAIIFVVISITVVSLWVISYRYPDFVMHHVHSFIHRISTLPQQVHLPSISLPASLSLPQSLKRAGEGKLVRWAQEDLELDAEDDVMVNGADAYDDFEMGAGDEYIPLRPSPRKGGRGRVKNYGSANPFW
ncbi:hypothetical protein MIND_00022700 [Mycena indigotica]|uniref:Autophagy-related protein 27 n=1 Tax=Mycena indigotica TaxID=2126181 RepID=A0A8H6TG18_9AGAR|nr:uncharacterized protein MIND_00022700 [Mycena indigotica]KAF7315085.1 hypothetical protein MIND_00022700 [Mycena indigotica]